MSSLVVRLSVAAASLQGVVGLTISPKNKDGFYATSLVAKFSKAKKVVAHSNFTSNSTSTPEKISSKPLGCVKFTGDEGSLHTAQTLSDDGQVVPGVMVVQKQVQSGAISAGDCAEACSAGPFFLVRSEGRECFCVMESPTYPLIKIDDSHCSSQCAVPGKVNDNWWSAKAATCGAPTAGAGNAGALTLYSWFACDHNAAAFPAAIAKEQKGDTTLHQTLSFDAKELPTPNGGAVTAEGLMANTQFVTGLKNALSSVMSTSTAASSTGGNLFVATAHLVQKLLAGSSLMTDASQRSNVARASADITPSEISIESISIDPLLSMTVNGPANTATHQVTVRFSSAAESYAEGCAVTQVDLSSKGGLAGALHAQLGEVIEAEGYAEVTTDEHPCDEIPVTIQPVDDDHVSTQPVDDDHVSIQPVDDDHVSIQPVDDDHVSTQTSVAGKL